MDFDEKDLENIIMKALEAPPKATATPTLLDYLSRRTARGASPFERGLPPIQFKPKEIKAAKVRRRSKRYPFLEIEV